MFMLGFGEQFSLLSASASHDGLIKGVNLHTCPFLISKMLIAPPWGMLSGLSPVNTQFYKQPAHKEYSKGQHDEILDGTLSSEQLGTSKSGTKGYGERLMPAVYGLHPAMNLSAL